MFRRPRPIGRDPARLGGDPRPRVRPPEESRSPVAVHGHSWRRAVIEETREQPRLQYLPTWVNYQENVVCPRGRLGIASVVGKFQGAGVPSSNDPFSPGATKSRYARRERRDEPVRGRILFPRLPSSPDGRLRTGVDDRSDQERRRAAALRLRRGAGIGHRHGPVLRLLRRYRSRLLRLRFVPVAGSLGDDVQRRMVTAGPAARVSRSVYGRRPATVRGRWRLDVARRWTFLTTAAAPSATATATAAATACNTASGSGSVGTAANRFLRRRPSARRTL